MKKEMRRLLPMYLSAIILGVFTIIFIIQGDYEFLTYAITLFPLIWVISKTDKIFNYTSLAKWGFAIWMFLHVAGGSIKYNGIRLYDTVFINLIAHPYNVLRYDQIIHSFCYFVITLFIYSIVVTMSRPPKKKGDQFLIVLIAFLASMGVSALNEIIELSTVAFFGSTGVGDYFNNALDLVFNAIGAIIALFFMHRRRNR